MNANRASSLILGVACAFFACALAVWFFFEAGVRSDGVLRTGDFVGAVWDDLRFAHQPEQPLILAFFTAECPWSRASVQGWNRLLTAEETANARPIVLAVSLSDSTLTEEFRRETNLAVEVIYAVDRQELGDKYKVVRVPVTILVDPSRSVRGVWYGAVDESRVAEILDALY